MAAMKEIHPPIEPQSSAFQPVLFTKKERAENYTIIGPQMSPLHFRLLNAMVVSLGYNVIILPEADPSAVDEGLKYVNNDACYPALMIVGQFIAALKSGKFDLNKTALGIAQTCGGCRSTNYISFIRKALNDLGWGHIPVIGLSAQNLEKHSGMEWSISALHKAMMCFSYGDVLMKCLYRTRPYELIPGSADALFEQKNLFYIHNVGKITKSVFEKMVKQTIHDFDTLPLRTDIRKPRIGVVGEILVKFNSAANNNIVQVIEAEGAEAVVPDLYDFFLYCVTDHHFNYEYLAKPKLYKHISDSIVYWMETYRKVIIKELNASQRFSPPIGIFNMAKLVDDIIQLGHNTGEGWLLTAEIIELLKSGVNSVACLQPFACLPNHVTGKGMIKELRRRYPGSNITAIDYDPGASEVNQLNRLKLLLSNSNILQHPDDPKIIHHI